MTRIPEPDQGHRTRTNVRYAAVAYDLSGNLIVAGEVTALAYDEDGNPTAVITPFPETDAEPTPDTH